MRTIGIALGTTLICANASAQGYFDFGQIPGVAERPKVQIDLNPTTLGFVIAAARATDPAAGDLISGIENVRVRVYDTTDDVEGLLSFIDDTSGELEADGWQRVVFVEDEHSKVRIYTKFEGTDATGLTVMVAEEGDEAVFVNIAGVIDPTRLGQLMNSVGAGGALQNLAGIDPDAVSAPAIDE